MPSGAAPSSIIKVVGDQVAPREMIEEEEEMKQRKRDLFFVLL